MAKKRSTVNKAGNYTKPGMRKRMFKRILASNVQGTAAGKWSARKAQKDIKQQVVVIDNVFKKNSKKFESME